MPYNYKAPPEFWRAFKKLDPGQQEAANQKLAIFKDNPFDSRLKTHRICRLSSVMRKTVYAVVILDDLRAVFYIDGSDVVSFGIGTHKIYKNG